MSSSDTATDEHAEITTAVHLADYFAYKNYSDLLKGILQQLNGLGVDIDHLPPHLKERIEFFGFRQMLLMHTRSSMGSLLTSFDELAKQWGERADRKGIPLLQWQTWRYKIAMQMGLDILRTCLELPPEHEAFLRPDTISLPRKFDFNQYKKSLENMFRDINENGRKNTVSAKTEHTHADMVTKALLDVLNESGHLFKDLASFVGEIEALVLDPPILRRPLPLATAETKTNEWGLHDRDAKGPYAAEAPAAVSAPVAAVEAGTVQQGDASSPDRDAKHTKLTRSKVRDRDNIEPVEAPAKGKRGRKAQKLEPVTEAYTQFDDGFEGDDQLEEMIVIGNQETERQDTQTSDEIFIHNSRGAVAAAQNLRTAREEYTRKHRGDDPLLSVLEASPAAVVSRAVGSKKVTTPISSLTASSCEPMSKKKSPLKRASIITARATAEQVTFEETESDSSSVTTPCSPHNTSKRLAVLEKKKFPKTIEQKTQAREPVFTGGGHRRVAWSVEEEEALVAGINRHGVGKWKDILSDPNLMGKFRDRTNVQLKDKHRNMVIAGFNFE